MEKKLIKKDDYRNPFWKWCPRGCGKRVKAVRGGKVRKYQCSICNKLFTKKQL